MTKTALSWATLIVFGGILVSCDNNNVGQQMDDTDKAKSVEEKSKSAIEPGSKLPSNALDFRITGRALTLENGMVKFAWPGVYIEAAFTGNTLGVVFGEDSQMGFNPGDNSVSYFDVNIDGQFHSTLIQPQSEIWIKNIPDHGQAQHHIKITKRNEAPTVINNFKGFIPAPGKSVTIPQTERDKSFVFIGDSYTAGYGLESDTRECTPEKVVATTNSTQTFAALTAKHFNANYQQVAYSGRGLARNFGGAGGPTMSALYDKVFPWERSPRVENAEAADVVVIGLGINDFSTPISAQESWTEAGLEDAYRERYHALLDWVQQYYEKPSAVVLSATWLGRDTAFAGLVQHVVEQRQAKGESNIVYWFYEGLDNEGCDWHPSAADHRMLATKLTELLRTRISVN
ncbi:Acetylxylan esterase / glucomannan deacetylase [Thalassocella blandensis]|nr:Acetylxylan esterase / glucomannan deacetylase [Thalassocella blandensis]